MKKLFLLFFLLISTSILAFEITESIRVRGFATLDATLNGSEDRFSMLSSGNPYLLEKDQVNFDYSNIGAQLEYDVIDSIGFMAQVLFSKREESTDYETTLEWLMLGYSFDNDYKLRLGKMKVPFMKSTENRYINYSFLWTRPQLANNGVNGFDDMYGVDLIKRTYIQDVDFEFQFTLGKVKHNKNLDKSKYLYNISALISFETSWFRFSYGQTVFDHFNRRGDLVNNDELLTFVSAESEFHFDNAMLFAGYGFNKNDSIPNEKYGYLSLAYEIDNITPYLLYSHQKVDGMPLFGIPNQLPISNSGFFINKNHAIGLRYDFYPGFALKVEYDLQQYKNHKLNTVDTTDSNIYTMTLDMVF